MELGRDRRVVAWKVEGSRLGFRSGYRLQCNLHTVGRITQRSEARDRYQNQEMERGLGNWFDEGLPISAASGRRVRPGHRFAQCSFS